MSEKLQNLMVSLGLNTPMKRALAGFLSGSVVVYYVQPESMFAKGEMRPFAPFAPDDPSKTWLPWWVPGLAVGATVSLLL